MNFYHSLVIKSSKIKSDYDQWHMEYPNSFKVKCGSLLWTNRTSARYRQLCCFILHEDIETSLVRLPRFVQGFVQRNIDVDTWRPIPSYLTMRKIWKYFFSQWGSLSNWWLLHSFVKAINRRHGRGYGVMAWVMWLLSWPWSLPIPWLWFLWPKELLLDDLIWFVTTYNTHFTWG